MSSYTTRSTTLGTAPHRNVKQTRPHAKLDHAGALPYTRHMGKHINYAPFPDETPWGRRENYTPRHRTNTICGNGILTAMSLPELLHLQSECRIVLDALTRNRMFRARVESARLEILQAIWRQ